MNDEDLEAEARKFCIGGYFDGNIIRRERIIEQLIVKDNAIMFRYTLLSTFITLIIALISRLRLNISVN